jgi:hypothetical protein
VGGPDSGEFVTNAPGGAVGGAQQSKPTANYEEVVMTTTLHEPSIAGPAREGIAARLLVPAFWGALSIVAMWLAVLFDGIYGGDMIFASPANGTTTIPSAVAVALFAVIGTAAVAKRAFARRDND